jgi:NADH-quinone oxidoreductase subunit I
MNFERLLDRFYGTGLLKGLYVTMRHFAGSYLTSVRRFPRRYTAAGAARTRGDPTLTGIFSIQYPEEKVPMFNRSRGPLIHLRDKETGQSRCTACQICVKACPHGCITLEPEGKGKERHPKWYRYDLGNCIYCRQCVESCPFNAIELSRTYELARYRKDMMLELPQLLEMGDSEGITEKDQYWH